MRRISVGLLKKPVKQLNANKKGNVLAVDFSVNAEEVALEQVA
jgi:hypothetical protein